MLKKVFVICLTMSLISGCETTTVYYSECEWSEYIALSEEGKQVLPRTDKEKIAQHNILYNRYCIQ